MNNVKHARAALPLEPGMKQLFLDDHVVAEAVGIARILHQLERRAT